MNNLKTKRVNITLPGELLEQIDRISENRSGFIASTIRKAVGENYQRNLHGSLIRGYEATSQEAREISKDWDSVSNEAWKRLER